MRNEKESVINLWMDKNIKYCVMSVVKIPHDLYDKNIINSCNIWNKRARSPYDNYLSQVTLNLLIFFCVVLKMLFSSSSPPPTRLADSSA